MPKVTVKTTTCKEKFFKTATNERRTRIMEEPRRVYKTDYQGNTSIPPRPDVLYGIMQNQEQIRYNQNVLSDQMNYLAGNVNNVLVKYKKDHKRRTDFFLAPTERGLSGIQYYDDESAAAVPITEMNYGKIILTKLEVMHQFEYLLIQWGDSILPIIVRMSEVTPASLYKEFKQKGIRFRVSGGISEAKIKQALYDYILSESSRCSRKIEKSGYAGWNDGKFSCAESEAAYAEYKNKLNLPVFSKHFDLDAANIARIGNYKAHLGRIKNPKDRVWFAIIPFCAIMFSPLRELKIYEPFVVNLVMMTDRVKLQELTSYLQIFNRTSADVCDVLESDKKIQNIVQSAKDETILFVGVQDETISPYKRQKIINNFASITKNALGKGCVTFDEGKSIRGIVVCMAGHTIMQREVSHIFIDDDFFDKYEEPLGKESMEAVWATFINYVEGRYEEVEKILRNNSLGTSLKEKYWRAILALVKDFWKAVGTSWNDVLNLSKDFSFDFLWNEETYDFEDASEAIVKIVRQEMGKISVIPKEKAQGGEEFVYDDNYLWIAPGLFTRWIQKSRLDAGKAELLIKCREEGLLLPGEYGGYTSRLQRGHIRKEYYRFVREKFTGVGQVEIIDLAGGK